MTDPHMTSQSSLLNKWSIESQSSLGKLSLRSSLLSQPTQSSLLSARKDDKFNLSLKSTLKSSLLLTNTSNISLTPNISLESKIPLSSTKLECSKLDTQASKGLYFSKEKPLESGLLKLSIKQDSEKHDSEKSAIKKKKYAVRNVEPAKSVNRKRTLGKSEKTEKRKKVQTDGIVSASVIRRHAIETPSYDLKIEENEYMEVDLPIFQPPTKDLRLRIAIGRSLTDILGVKRGLINLISGSLINQPNFKMKVDVSRQAIMESVSSVVEYDPEFILKVAVYSRKELNIRTTSNFLLALASNIGACRHYLKKYFSVCIVLPTDWIEVAEIYQTLGDSSLKLGALPAALRKAMISKFPDFDKYQLAKYNKQSSGKKKKAKAKKSKSDKKADKEAIDAKKMRTRRIFDSDSSSEEEDNKSKTLDTQTSVMFDEKESPQELANQRFSIKQLIRKLHIKEPVEHVMSIIGKRYPSSLDEFYAARLPGTYEEERAGKRMKLPVPETWETQVSLKGNKAKTWEDLIDHKKLPFMAMLRNLRNLIKAGISPKHHNFVIKRLSDQRSVVNSKQFPFRFFSAYVVLQELEKAYEENQKEIIEAAENTAMAGGIKAGNQTGRIMRGHIAKPVRSRGRGGIRGARGGARGSLRGTRGGTRGGVRGGIRGGLASAGRGTNEEKIEQYPWWILKKAKKQAAEGVKEVPYDISLIQRYRKALDVAVQIATVHNVQPIKGRTVVLCDMSMKLDRPCTSAKGLGKPRTLLEISVLMALMCKYSCEECEMIIFSDRGFRDVQLKKGTILDNMEEVLTTPIELNSPDPCATEGLPYPVLLEKLRDRIQVDNLLIFGEDFYPSSPAGAVLGTFLKNYRHVVNPNLLFVSVTFSGLRAGFSADILPEHENDIYISGFSDAILRFIAERGDSGQVNHVDKIDEAYKLRPMPRVHQHTTVTTPSIPKQQNALKLVSPIPSWRTIRVFISSTFRDMHAERDLLTRFVFPELRAVAAKNFLNVYEVDLRWGVTEEETRSNKTLETCLSEVSRCQIFIGLLGERYGWTPECYHVPDSEEFDWIRHYPPSSSVTELEMHLGALSKVSEVKETAFFFLRNKSFESDIPKEFEPDFKTGKESDRIKLESLKKRIRNSGLDVYDDYPCHWGGCVDGKPMVAGLEQFGARMLNTLMNALSKLCPNDTEEILSEDEHIEELQWSFIEKSCVNFVCRQVLVKKVLHKINSLAFGVVGVSGKAGCGKTSLMAAVIKELIRTQEEVGTNVFVNIAGSAPGTTNLITTVRRLASQINTRFGLGQQMPEDLKDLCAKLADLLKDAGTVSPSRVVVFLDGTDMMSSVNEPFSLEWLPKPVPDNVVFVITALDGEKTHKSLKRLGADVIDVGDLDMWDKAELVRQTLAKHRKSLDESGFGNQMKLLMLKKGAHNPLYLKLACEELRVFGVFEKISDKLKSLPHTSSQILQEVLQRLEDEHGHKLVRASLCFLALARDGLYAEELHELLSWYTFLKGQSYSHSSRLQLTDKIPPVKFTFLARSIMSFLNPSSMWSPMLFLSNDEIRTAVQMRYMKGMVAAETQSTFHRLLADFFLRLADPKKDYTWQSQSTRAFSELPYHLACCGDFFTLERIICNHKFIQAKCRLGLAAKLMEDFSAKVVFTKTLERDQNKFLSLLNVQQYKSFVSRNIEVLVNYPTLEWQQALNEPSVSLPFKDALDMKRLDCSTMPYLEWNNKPESVDPCYMKMSNLKTVATCVKLSPSNAYFATGSEDALVRLYDFATGKEVRVFNGHSDSVTDVCFAGDNILCSASVDTSLSVWDVEHGHRIHVLQSHTRRVNSCVSSKDGKLLASTGWDCFVYVWQLNSGSKLCDFNVGRPINCVDFHPSEELVVVGSWDAVIRIYNYFHKTRVAVLRGHSVSVRDICYSVDGRHIASSDLDGHVRIWSASKGAQVGNVKGHALPINKLCFSPTGKELITASDDNQVKVWSGDLGVPLHRLQSENVGAATSVAICPYGNLVAVGFHQGQVRMHDVTSGVRLFEIKLCSSAVRAVTFSKDGCYVVAGTDDNFAQVLESTQGTRVCSLGSHSKPVLCVDVGYGYVVTGSEDFTCCVYNELNSLKSRKQASPLAILKNHIAPVTAVTLNRKENLLATAGRDASVVIYDMASVVLSDGSVSPSQVLHNCHADWINSCRWSDIGDFLVTASNDFNLKVWDVKSGKEKCTLTGHSSAVNCVGFKYGCIVSGSSDGSVKVWSHKGVEITTLHGHSLRVNACDIFVRKKNSKNWNDQLWTDAMEMENEEGYEKAHKEDNIDMDDVLVVSASDDGVVRVWKPLQANGLATLTGHSDRVLSVTADKSCKIVSCGLDNSIRLWRPELVAEPELGKHDAQVTFVAASRGNSLVITGSRDGTVKIWKRGFGRSMDLKYSFQAHGKSANCGTFESNDTFVTGSDDGYIVRWNIVERKDGIFVRQGNTDQLEMPLSTLCSFGKKTFVASWDGFLYTFPDTKEALRIHEEKRNSGFQSVAKYASCCYLVSDLLILGTIDSTVLFVQITKEAKCVVKKLIKLSTEKTDEGIPVEKRRPNWVHAVTRADKVTLAGDSRGQLHFISNKQQNSIKIHAAALTGLTVKRNLLITASMDCSIKIWTFEEDNVESLKQIGQFFCPAPVSCLLAVSEFDEDGLRLVAGDQLGNVHQLTWHP